MRKVDAPKVGATCESGRAASVCKGGKNTTKTKYLTKARVEGVGGSFGLEGEKRKDSGKGDAYVFDRIRGGMSGDDATGDGN